MMRSHQAIRSHSFLLVPFHLPTITSNTVCQDPFLLYLEKNGKRRLIEILLSFGKTLLMTMKYMTSFLTETSPMKVHQESGFGNLYFTHLRSRTSMILKKNGFYWTLLISKLLT
ncbi:hypothetical protein MC885_011997 [Smutsia gigantea]|nr:hypothetical protein MC885_011997 [Smutsia gigantea]